MDFFVSKIFKDSCNISIKNMYYYLWKFAVSSIFSWFNLWNWSYFFRTVDDTGIAVCSTIFGAARLH